MCIFLCIFWDAECLEETMGMVLGAGTSQQMFFLEIATNSDKSFLIFDFQGTSQQLSQSQVHKF